jgi:hypothetical protein
VFLVEEKTSPNGQCSAAIYMRPDGLFEGRIYRTGIEVAGRPAKSLGAGFEVCGVTETLPRLETIVDEELGL